MFRNKPENSKRPVLTAHTPNDKKKKTNDGSLLFVIDVKLVLYEPLLSKWNVVLLMNVL